MDEGKFLAALQHIVGAIHQLAVSSASGLPHVVAMANSAQALLNDLMPQPEPARNPDPEPAPPVVMAAESEPEPAPVEEAPPPPVAPSWSPPSEPAA